MRCQCLVGGFRNRKSVLKFGLKHHGIASFNKLFRVLALRTPTGFSVLQFREHKISRCHKYRFKPKRI